MDKTPYIRMVSTTIFNIIMPLNHIVQRSREEYNVRIANYNETVFDTTSAKSTIKPASKAKSKYAYRDPPIDPTENFPNKITYKNIELLLSHNKQNILNLIQNFELVELRELLCVFIADFIQMIPDIFKGFVKINELKLTLKVITSTIKLYAKSDVKNITDMLAKYHEINDPCEELKINYKERNTQYAKLQLEHEELKEKFNALKKVLL